MIKKKVNKKRLFRRSILVVLCGTLLFMFILNKMSKEFGFEGISDFYNNYSQNSSFADSASPSRVKILLNEADYNYLADKRKTALDRGIQINIGENYVPCELVLNGETIVGEMRLKGHMTDHLEGEKWSFRVKTQKEFMGMYRFSLQHPGTRHYVNEWLYHELLKNEDIIYLLYDFIHLDLNEKDLGIYAIEEHFGQHVLERNNRSKGAILRWNPQLYWEGRIDEYQKKYLNQQYGHYYSSFAEPYDKGKALDDPEIKANYIEGATKLELFRRGELITSEVFDVKLMARFHAIIDLVGGHHSLDWSDVKYYYNPETERIEPVGYESFSVQKTESIAGQQLPEKFNGIESDYHERLFADPIFFEAYIIELERIASEEYLNEFKKKITPVLNQKLGVLGKEFAYILFDWQPYFDNIELIRHNLSLPKAVHPFLVNSSDSTIQLSIGAVSDFPIEIISLEVNGKRTFQLDTKEIIPAKERNTFTNYTTITFPNNGKKVKNLILNCKIPGSSYSFTVEVAEYPPFTPSNVPVDSLAIFIPPSNYSSTLTISDNYLIPSNETVLLTGYDTIYIGAEASFTINGNLEIIGYNEQPTVIHKHSNNEINSKSFIVSSGNLVLENVQLTGKNDDLIYAEAKSTISMHQSEILGGSTIFSGSNSDFILTSSFIGDFNQLGNFSNCCINLKEIHAGNGTKLLTAEGGIVRLNSCTFNRIKEVITGNLGCDVQTWNCRIKHAEKAFALNDAAYLKYRGGLLENVDLAVSLDKNMIFNTPSTYSLYNPKTVNLSKKDNK